MTTLSDLQAAKDRITKAIHAAKAYDWLLQFHPTTVDIETGLSVAATIEVSQFRGSSCEGSNEGHIYLNRAAKARMVEIGNDAMALALSDIKAAYGELKAWP